MPFAERLWYNIESQGEVEENAFKFLTNLNKTMKRRVFKGQKWQPNKRNK